MTVAVIAVWHLCSKEGSYPFHKEGTFPFTEPGVANSGCHQGGTTSPLSGG